MGIGSRFVPRRRREARRGSTLAFTNDRLQIATLEGGWISVTRAQWSALVDRVERLLEGPASPLPASETGWSDDDDAALRAMWTAGGSMDVMIKRLDRNSVQIERRLFKLGIIASRRALQGR